MTENATRDQRTLNGIGEIWRWLMHRGPKGTLKHISKKGPRELLRLVKLYLRTIRAHRVNRNFDKRYRINTWGGLRADQMDIVGGNQDCSEIYAPMPEKTFHHVMRSIDVDFQNFTFVDYGSGKGKILLMASEYPFKKIIGVEFARDLHVVAQKNVLRYENKKQRCFDIEPQLADACEFILPEGNCVLFFFAPFFGPVLHRVLENIKRSLEDNPRQVAIVYMDDDVPHSKIVEVESAVVSWGFFFSHPLRNLPFDPGALMPVQGKVWLSR